VQKHGLLPQLLILLYDCLILHVQFQVFHLNFCLHHNHPFPLSCFFQVCPPSASSPHNKPMLQHRQNTCNKLGKTAKRHGGKLLHYGTVPVEQPQPKVPVVSLGWPWTRKCQKERATKGLF